PRGGGSSLGPLGVTAAVLSVCVLASSGFLYNRYLHYNHNLSRINGAITKTGGAKATAGAENVLLVGSDSRAGTGDQFAQAPKGQEQDEGQRSTAGTRVDVGMSSLTSTNTAI